MTVHGFLGKTCASLGISLFMAGGTFAEGAFIHDVQVSTVEASGRNVMRTADGGLVAAFGTPSGKRINLIFSRSNNNGRSWDNVQVEEVSGTVKEVAVDSNFNGSYLAFTEKINGKFRGRIAYLTDPFASKPKIIVSDSVTPAGILPIDTFVQASRAGWGNLATDDRETIAYGWQDARSKAIYIGVSPDGKSFPLAQLVVSDKYATSGPAVAIRGRFVIATYLTKNPAIIPNDISIAHHNRKPYPAWVESLDGGVSWSKPAPLFGRTLADFPSTELEYRPGQYRHVKLAGGTSQRNSPILNWASSAIDERFPTGPDADKTLPFLQGNMVRPALRPGQLAEDLGGTTFVQSSMVGVGISGKPGEVSIVSFRAIEPGAKWTHVIANNRITSVDKSIDSRTSRLTVQASQFQYSALIDTAVRATVYKETDPQTQSVRLVAAVSTDTGKSFQNHVSFSKEQLSALGIEDFNSTTVFAASQCLFEDRDGKVYVDVIFANNAGMHYARIPIGVNAAELRTGKR